MFYGVDIALIYWAATSVNPGPLFLLAFPLVWIILYIYYHYKRRYLKIREDESYKKYSNIWAILFLILPFIILTYIIHSGFISGYQNRYGDNLKPPTNVYHRMTA